MSLIEFFPGNSKWLRSVDYFRKTFSINFWQDEKYACHAMLYQKLPNDTHMEELVFTEKIH